MSARKVHIDKEEWKYTIGRKNVKIRSPEGKGYAVSFAKLTGMDWSSIERTAGKHSFHITPQMVKDYIVDNIRKK